MSDEGVAQLMAFTGISDPNEARSFLEMAGGNVEIAAGLVFGDGGGGDFGAAAMPSEPSNWGPAYLKGVVVSGGDSKLQSEPNWLDQDVKFSEHEGETIGLVQHKNGPCGALSVLNAVLIAKRLASQGSAQADTPFKDDEVVSVFCDILLGCCEDDSQKVTLCSWKTDRAAGEVASDEISRDQLAEAVRDHIPSFMGKGGLLLLIFSCVETRGQDNLKKDVAVGGGELPLIAGPNLLCTFELMNLLLCGRAHGSVGAYSILGGKNEALPTHGGVGLLSISEKESGIPVRDDLKSPSTPVWILHSSDHFTVLFKEKMEASLQPPQTLLHFNGLPPNGPRLCEILLQGSQVAGSAPDKQKESYFKPKPGEIEDIVQAQSDDKTARPDEWTTWRYEAVLAIDDPSVQGPERPSDLPPPKIFKLDQEPQGEWRCSSCYRTRFQTMCFGQNPASTGACVHCNLPKSQAGWTLWLHYDDLPIEWQRKMNDRHSTAITKILQTQWPDCKLSLSSSSRKSEIGLPSA